MSSLLTFSANSLACGSVRRALDKFRDDYQQPVALLLTLGWLVAEARQPANPTIEALYALASEWESQRLAPLRRQQRDAEAAGDMGQCARLRQAEKHSEAQLLAQLGAQASEAEPASGGASLAEVLLMAMPKIGFCQGQSELLELLVDRWDLAECQQEV